MKALSRVLVLAVLLAAGGLLSARPAQASPGDTVADTVWGQTDFVHGNPVSCPTPTNATTLCVPMDSVRDAAGNLWVADYGNSRVLMFPTGSKTATRVFGQYGDFTLGFPGDTSDGCNQSPPSGSQFPAPAPASRYTLCRPEGLAIDTNGTLYVADTYNSRVLVYLHAASKTGGAPADLVLGQGNFSDNGQNDTPAGTTGTLSCPDQDSNLGGTTRCSLAEPWGVSVDPHGNVFVADTLNSRVLEWPATTLSSLTTASCTSTCSIPAGSSWGQYGSLTVAMNNNPSIPDSLAASCPVPSPASQCTLFHPTGAVADSGGTLYVADYANNRILAYVSGVTTGAQVATRVLGQAGSFLTNVGNNGGTSATSIWNAPKLSLDPGGNLWVADTINSRVLRYSSGSTIASLVLGQGSFATGNQNSGGIGASSLASPNSVQADVSGNIVVADSDNNRVLEYTGPLAATSEAPKGTSTDPSTGAAPAAAYPVPAVSLTAGWNALSVDTTKYADTGALLVAIQSQNSGLHARVAATFASGKYLIDIPGYGNPIPLTEGDAVFVLTDTTGSFTPAGTAPSAPVPVMLRQGWNFVSSAYPHVLDADQVCRELSPLACSEVAAYQNGWKTFTPASTSFSLTPGRGFMVLVQHSGTWMPYISVSRPRLIFTPELRAMLTAKVIGNDASWQALKATADQQSTYSIDPYIYEDRTEELDNTIFYDYQASGWLASALPLGISYVMTGEPRYAATLLQIADEMIAAQLRPQNTTPVGAQPIQVDSYYPSRSTGPTIALIYDWCYSVLGGPRKAKMINLMNVYYDDVRANGYEVNTNSDGNYQMGHTIAAAWMGYASFGDNPRAQEMIDFARIRLDGSPSPLLDPANVPNSNVAQVFDGGYLSYAGVPGAPFSAGFDFQGWAYGSGTLAHLFDYFMITQSATGENLVGKHSSWARSVLRAMKQALLPDRIEIDPRGEWGSDYGAIIPESLPLRLTYLLAGTADGPGAQHFLRSEIDPTQCAAYPTCPPETWEDFIFGDPNRPSAPLVMPPYYGGYAPAYPQGGAGNGALPYFIMRSDFGSNAIWASTNMGAAFYDDHQHSDAGTITIKHGADYLLVSAGDWKGDLGSVGFLGSGTEDSAAGAANTLYFNDFGDAQCTGEFSYTGGAGVWGLDQLVADEQNGSYSYVRSDLSSNYNTGGPDGCYQSRLQALRELDYFYRSFIYLRSANLFLVYDEAKALPSTNPHGAYLKHLRWHFPNTPKVSGKTVTVTQGASRLYMDMLLPQNVALSVVDERANPDGCDFSVTPCLPCDGTADGLTQNCTPWAYGATNTGTMRVEVREPGNPLASRFLTVFQVGDSATPHETVTNLSSAGGSMTGAYIVQSTGTNVVLFNAGAGQTPTPITSVSYTFSGPSTTVHTLCGMTPNAKYAIVRTGQTVTVTQSASGTIAASAAGVLTFTM